MTTCFPFECIGQHPPQGRISRPTQAGSMERQISGQSLSLIEPLGLQVNLSSLPPGENSTCMKLSPRMRMEMNSQLQGQPFPHGSHLWIMAMALQHSAVRQVPRTSAITTWY